MLILKPSKIQGVGVFTTKPILCGADPFGFTRCDAVKMKKVDRLLKKYCVWHPDEKCFYGPRDFHRMAVWWYLNHSTKPNICIKTWRTLRRIAAWEELVIDYREFKENE